ncbi:MAG: hypothetical protein ABIJ97_17385 [Bacteroidota bacterium]
MKNKKEIKGKTIKTLNKKDLIVVNGENSGLYLNRKLKLKL